MSTTSDEFVTFAISQRQDRGAVPVALYDHGFLPPKGRALRTLLLRSAGLAAAEAKAVRAVSIPRQRSREPELAGR